MRRDPAPPPRIHRSALPRTAEQDCTHVGHVLCGTAWERHMRTTLRTTQQVAYAQNAATAKYAKHGERKRGMRAELDKPHPVHHDGGTNPPTPKPPGHRNGGKYRQTRKERKTYRITHKQRYRQRHIRAESRAAKVRHLTNQQKRSRQSQQRSQATTCTECYGSNTSKPTLTAHGAPSKTTKKNALSSPAYARFGHRTYTT